MRRLTVAMPFVFSFTNQTHVQLSILQGLPTWVDGKLQMKNIPYQDGVITASTVEYAPRSVVPGETIEFVVECDRKDVSSDAGGASETLLFGLTAMRIDEAAGKTPENWTEEDTLFAEEIKLDFGRTISERDMTDLRREARAETSGYDGVCFTGVDLDGNEVDDALIETHAVTAVVYWTSKAEGCARQMKIYADAAARYAQEDVAFLGVQMDGDSYAAQTVWQESGAAYPSIHAAGDFYSRFTYASMGISFAIELYDRAGKKIGNTHNGPHTAETLDSVLDGALNG